MKRVAEKKKSLACVRGRNFSSWYMGAIWCQLHEVARLCTRVDLSIHCVLAITVSSSTWSDPQYTECLCTLFLSLNLLVQCNCFKLCIVRVWTFQTCDVWKRRGKWEKERRAPLSSHWLDALTVALWKLLLPLASAHREGWEREKKVQVPNSNHSKYHWVSSAHFYSSLKLTCSHHHTRCTLGTLFRLTK